VDAVPFEVGFGVGTPRERRLAHAAGGREAGRGRRRVELDEVGALDPAHLPLDRLPEAGLRDDLEGVGEDHLPRLDVEQPQIDLDGAPEEGDPAREGDVDPEHPPQLLGRLLVHRAGLAEVELVEELPDLLSLHHLEVGPPGEGGDEHLGDRLAVAAFPRRGVVVLEVEDRDPERLLEAGDRGLLDPRDGEGEDLHAAVAAIRHADEAVGAGPDALRFPELPAPLPSPPDGGEEAALGVEELDRVVLLVRDADDPHRPHGDPGRFLESPGPFAAPAETEQVGLLGGVGMHGARPRVEDVDEAVDSDGDILDAREPGPGDESDGAARARDVDLVDGLGARDDLPDERPVGVESLHAVVAPIGRVDPPGVVDGDPDGVAEAARGAPLAAYLRREGAGLVVDADRTVP